MGGARVTGRRAGEKDMSEQTIMACMDENTIMDSISLSTNLENNKREAEKIREFSRKYWTTQRTRRRLSPKLKPFIVVFGTAQAKPSSASHPATSGRGRESAPLAAHVEPGEGNSIWALTLLPSANLDA